ncbi:uncharacterized protein TrAtP1_002903 [Trichoderma atroviride]|uniref:uncharacterized protein n=1 Tax=Hypocrea atroviridis TaxID=63577 RepID=UPI0033327199|nr:hypothetical protein TrAtP1_002903 [Trichoderma atroviride]
MDTIENQSLGRHRLRGSDLPGHLSFSTEPSRSTTLEKSPMRLRLGLGSFPILQTTCCAGTKEEKKNSTARYIAIITKQQDYFFFWNHFLHSRPQSEETAERLPSYTKLEEASARNRLHILSK